MSQIAGGDDCELQKARRTLAIIMTIAYVLATPSFGGGLLLFSAAAVDNACRAGQSVVKLALYMSSTVPFAFIVSGAGIWVFRAWKTWRRMYLFAALPWVAVFLAYVGLFFAANVPCR